MLISRRIYQRLLIFTSFHADIHVWWITHGSPCRIIYIYFFLQLNLHCFLCLFDKWGPLSVLQPSAAHWSKVARNVVAAATCTPLFRSHDTHPPATCYIYSITFSLQTGISKKKKNLQVLFLTRIPVWAGRSVLRPAAAVLASPSDRR